MFLRNNMMIVLMTKRVKPTLCINLLTIAILTLRQNNLIDKDESKTTLINDQVRVYKGGSWKDRAYWLDPAQRRFYPQDQATDFIGFRCAMSRLGPKSSSKRKTRN